MNTNKVFIGNIYQVTSCKVKGRKKNYGFGLLKENAILYKKKDGDFFNLETDISYMSDLSDWYDYPEIGKAMVLSNMLKIFNFYLDEEKRNSDLPKQEIVQAYNHIKKTHVEFFFSL